MGGAYQSRLTSDEIDELSSRTNFTHQQLETLYRRFKKIDRTRRGQIGRNEFYLIPEFAMNPISTRLFLLFDEAGLDDVTFDKFTQVIKTFSTQSSPHEKLEALFFLFDVDKDGKISENDLISIMKLLIGDNIKESLLIAICRQSMRAHYYQVNDVQASVRDSTPFEISLDEFRRIIGDVSSVGVTLPTPID